MKKISGTLITFLLLLSIASEGLGQLQHEPYRGKFLNKFNAYHTQILGDVYIVDLNTIFIKGFTYDGKSPDAYFMIGSTLRPNNEGTVIPNEEGKTNVLIQYIYRDITLKLPKKVTEVRWLAVYDLFKLTTLADVSIPEGYEPPSSQTLKPFQGVSHGISSDSVVVIDSKTLHIPDFSYDGSASEVYFWIGSGTAPSPKGKKLPDENGYLSPLHSYSHQSIILELPGNLTVFDIHWLSVWNPEANESYGHVMFPHDLTVPPALVNIIAHENRLPQCEQLHKNLQISWEVFGPQITIELAGMIGEYDYMAFGISGSSEQSQMMGADLAVVYIDSWQGIAKDYSVSEKAPCTRTVDRQKGVCPDLLVGGLDDLQFIMHERKDNLTIITYRRSLISPDPGDKNYTETDTYIVWAVGHLSNKKEPLFHYLYPKGNVKLDFGRKPATKNCYYYATKIKRIDTVAKSRWSPLEIKNPLVTNLSVSLGPSGGQMGYEAFTGNPSQQLAWYVNGLLAPEIYLKRYQKYRFTVEGGNDVFSALYNNPFYISNDPEGGYDRLTPLEQKRVRIYAGVNFDRKDVHNPFVSGRLCTWENRSLDLRLMDQFPNFLKFRQNLRYRCDGGNPGILEWVPNKTTPDVVYYQSYKHPYMGWKIYIVDQISISHQPSIYKAAESSLGLVVVFLSYLCNVLHFEYIF